MAIAVITSFVQQCDSNGVPLNAGTIDVYAAGTTTPLSLYPNSDLTGSTTNPITLDSSGRHAIAYIATASYKIVVKNASGTTIYTRDNIDPGVAVGSGALPVANGGTGATTAASARTNLAAAAATDMATAQSDISNLQTWAGYNLTTRTRIASGTTAQEPAAGTVGIRYNSTTGYFRGDTGAAWKNIPYAGQILPSDFATGQAVICIQRSRNLISSGSYSTTTPFDSTIPQITEGSEIATATFTPLSASSLVIVRAIVGYETNVTAQVIFHLHKNGGLSAVAASTLRAENVTIAPTHYGEVLQYSESPGSTSAITYALRVGPSASGNVVVGGTSTLGGVIKSWYIIEEWLSP